MKKPVVMLGSFVVDLMSRQKGLPRPGETLLGGYYGVSTGGKGSNQAVAAHRAGANVILATKIGGDLFADMALEFYRKEGISTDFVFRDANLPTGAALIMVDEDSAQNAIVVVPSACMNVLPEEVLRLREAIEGAGVLLVQLEINPEATFAAVDVAWRAGVKVVLNPAPAGAIPSDVFPKIGVITPNETEAAALTGIAIRQRQDAREAAAALMERGVGSAVITLGSMGAFATDGAREEWLERISVNAIDTTGAGDAFSGALAAALAEGANLFEAARFANAAAALSVTRRGSSVSMAARPEIDALYREHYKNLAGRNSI